MAPWQAGASTEMLALPLSLGEQRTCVPPGWQDQEPFAEDSRDGKCPAGGGVHVPGLGHSAGKASVCPAPLPKDMVPWSLQCLMSFILSS